MAKSDAPGDGVQYSEGWWVFEFYDGFRRCHPSHSENHFRRGTIESFLRTRGSRCITRRIPRLRRCFECDKGLNNYVDLNGGKGGSLWTAKVWAAVWELAKTLKCEECATLDKDIFVHQTEGGVGIGWTGMNAQQGIGNVDTFGGHVTLTVCRTGGRIEVSGSVDASLHDNYHWAGHSFYHVPASYVG